jgi:hypothetical protein
MGITHKPIKLFKEELEKDSRRWYQGFISGHYDSSGYSCVTINSNSLNNIREIFNWLDENVSALDWDIQGASIYFTNDSDRILFALIFN